MVEEEEDLEDNGCDTFFAFFLTLFLTAFWNGLLLLLLLLLVERSLFFVGFDSCFDFDFFFNSICCFLNKASSANLLHWKQLFLHWPCLSPERYFWCPNFVLLWLLFFFLLALEDEESFCCFGFCCFCCCCCCFPLLLFLSSSVLCCIL